MKRQEDWSAALDSSPFLAPRFTERLMREIAVQSKSRRSAKRKLSLTAAAAAILILAGAGLWTAYAAISSGTGANQASPAVLEDERTVYEKDGKILFRVFQDGRGVTAGVEQGYMISFTEPFSVYQGKRLTIEADQPASNTHLEVYAQTITKPDSGFDSLERFMAWFGLPLSGRWIYTVKLDGEYYGDFVLDVYDPPTWQPSPTFRLPYTGNDGKSHAYVLTGEQGKLGFLVGPYMNEKGELLERQPMIAGRMNKYMWFLWNSREKLSGPFSVSAVKEGERREIGIFSMGMATLPIGGDYVKIPSSMALPEPGMWRLNAYVGGKWFGSVYVEVEPQEHL